MTTVASLDELGPVDYWVVEFPAGVGVIGAPVAKTAVAAAVTPGRGVGRRRI